MARGTVEKPSEFKSGERNCLNRWAGLKDGLSTQCVTFLLSAEVGCGCLQRRRAGDRGASRSSASAMNYIGVAYL